MERNKVGLQVIGAGVGRTGTTSLKAALEHLLGGSCYHMYEVFQNHDHIPQWHGAVRGQEPDWQALYRNYVATVDWPGAAFWRQLSISFPNALVVLSIRDSDAWFSSFDATINELMRRRPTGSTKAWYAMAHDLLRTTFAPAPVSRDAAIAAYLRHNDVVKVTLPRDRLLVWEPGDGWEPLCERLGLPVPDEEFPHLNTTDDYRAVLQNLPDRKIRRWFRRLKT